MCGSACLPACIKCHPSYESFEKATERNYANTVIMTAHLAPRFLVSKYHSPPGKTVCGKTVLCQKANNSD